MEIYLHILHLLSLKEDIIRFSSPDKVEYFLYIEPVFIYGYEIRIEENSKECVTLEDKTEAAWNSFRFMLDQCEKHVH